MRVITGTAKGFKLLTPEGIDTRPTAERVKEAVFSSLQFDIVGKKVLDLFAGSGQMGIEALSRGADFAVFIDSSAGAINIIKENLDKTDLMRKARVSAMDALEFILSSKEEFDYIFLDPPFLEGYMAQVLAKISRLCSPGAKIICETEKTEDLPLEIGELILKKTSNYGRIKISTYIRSN